jgi:hypothetical protein
MPIIGKRIEAVNVIDALQPNESNNSAREFNIFRTYCILNKIEIDFIAELYEKIPNPNDQSG